MIHSTGPPQRVRLLGTPDYEVDAFKLEFDKALNIRKEYKFAASPSPTTSRS